MIPCLGMVFSIGTYYNGGTMKQFHLNTAFFFGALFLVGVMVLFLFSPFFTAMVMAAVFVMLFHQPYTWILLRTHGRASLSAFLTCLLVIFVIVMPVFVLLSLVINEANALYSTIVTEGQSLESVSVAFLQRAADIPAVGRFLNPEVLQSAAFTDGLQSLSRNALGFLQTASQGIAHFFFWTFVVFFTLYYFLVDGKRALNYLMRISPLRNEHDRLLIERFVSISRATVKGTLLIGVLQGALGALMFFIVGIPSPLVWGLFMVFFSIIPMLGSGIVWFPAGIILLMMGDIWQGFFVLGVGMGIISSIDNVLRPMLVGNDTKMHPLLVFFATLGGLSLFGVLGFIIGPIIVALFLALMEIYTQEFRQQMETYNDAVVGT